MSYELEPKVIRLTPFNSEGGGALAAVQIAFGPIVLSTKLCKNGNGFFLSLPSRRSEARDRWFEQVVITDPMLKMMAQTKAVIEYEKHAQGELIAV